MNYQNWLVKTAALLGVTIATLVAAGASEKAFANGCSAGSSGCTPVPPITIPGGGNTNNDTNNQFDNNANADNNNNLSGTIQNVNVNNVGNSTFKFDGLECPTPNLSASIFGGYNTASTGRSDSNAMNIGASASINMPLGGKVGRSCNEAFAAKTAVQTQLVIQAEGNTINGEAKICDENIARGITVFPVEIFGERLSAKCTAYVALKSKTTVTPTPEKPPVTTPPTQEKPPATGNTTPTPVKW